MDSGNSGSLQSSSGGDEEYDSRASHVDPISNPSQPRPPPPPPVLPFYHHPTPPSSMFDPLSNYFNPMSRPTPPPHQNPNSLINLDMVWSKTLQSEPNSTEINHFFSPPCQGQSRGTFTASSSAPTVPYPPVIENVTPRASFSMGTSDQQTQVVRNTKKRSRASRRAPTTVLTTDTSNFRAMVQEFTGIPAPPFTSPSFPRSRLDLFGTPSTMRSNSLDISQPPPYLLRPFAQKIQPPQPPFVSSSSPSSLSSSLLADAIASTNTNNITSGSNKTASNSTSFNYQQLPSELGLLKQPQNSSLLDMQNPILAFPSFFQNPPKYPLANSVSLGSKTQGSLEISSNDSHLKMGVLDEFSLSHGQVNSTNLSGLPNLVSSDGAVPRNGNNNPVNWVNDGVGSNDGDQGHLRSDNGGYDYSRNVTNGKLNYSASSSNFQGGKGSDNGSTRGEGMMESWICSSDH